jgi:hypothetical protein
MATFEIDRSTTRLIVQAIIGLALLGVLFFMIRSLTRRPFAKSELPDAGEGLKYTDSGGKTRTYDPVPLAETLHRILNEDLSWYTFYDIDVTALESALAELHRLPTPDMKYAVIDTYTNQYRQKYGTLEERLKAASYILTDPTYRDRTLSLIRNRNQYIV